MKKIYLLIFIIILTSGCKDNIKDKFVERLREVYGFKCDTNETVCSHEDVDEKNANGAYQNVTITHTFNFSKNVFEMIYWRFAINGNKEYQNMYQTSYNYKNNKIISIHNLSNSTIYKYYYVTQELEIYENNNTNNKTRYNCLKSKNKSIIDKCNELRARCESARAEVNRYLANYSINDIIDE